MKPIVLLCRIDGNFGGVERTLLHLAAHLLEFHPVIVPIANHGELERSAREDGLTVDFLPMPSRLSILAARRSLIEIARRHSARIIHTFGIRSNLLACLSRKRLNVPWVARVPNVSSTDYANPLLGRLSHVINNQLLSRADAVQVISPQLRDYYAALTRPPARIDLIPNGVDAEFFSPVESNAQRRASLGLPEHGHIIGSVGRLDPVKGFKKLIDAFASLKLSWPDASLLIAGDGPERDELLRTAREYGVADSLYLPGFIQDVRSCLAVMDVYVCSSISEGVPNAMLEAMSMSRCVLSTRVGGVESILRDGCEGVLLHEASAREIRERLHELLSDPDERKRLGANARDRVINEFTLRNMAQSVEAMYRELIDR
ncbi:MAG: glycosyltransferase [bacterium]|nr:glycosyltransferase [bacterium]